ncbi:hypothetical protein [Sphingomonas sp. Leaf21]|jgi:hypothetical protein|uniref:hypothetical protein n=1 Tax=Sphingomonas sp. Leaf21 TaxID=2876550 RepID=UPI001E59CC58|nr:hypothetical protein [Sphingomonas sp. Leaf21]
MIPALGLVALLAASPVSAEANDKRSVLLAAAAECTSITDTSARLACYDRTVAALVAAERKHDVVVIDRAQVRQTRKTLFGLNLPNLGLFGDGGDKDGPEAVNQIESTLQRADVEGGAWIFTLKDGARWRQTDDNVIGGKPRVGSPVVIRRGALGSFKLSLAGQPAVKVRREN